MINRAAITQWNKIVPWNDNAQVEQDLIISRALVAIFSDGFLASQLAFRGGTALHKLYLSPQPRYSEDIDLVQITPGPIKPIMFRLGEVLSFLPDRVTKQKRYNNTMLFRMESEVPPVVPLRLKIEINCFEHFNELGLVKIPFEMENSWFSGKCEITTYCLNELLGTKLRALYQRKKGRDLFDLYVALSQASASRQCSLNKFICSALGFSLYLHLMKYRNGDEKLFDGHIENGTETRLRQGKGVGLCEVLHGIFEGEGRQ